MLPYHFVRMSYGHPFLASYWAVPLIGLLLLVSGGEETDPLARWTARITDPRRRRLLRAAIIVVAAAVAWTQSYYFVFGVILLGSAWALAALAAFLRRSAPRTLAWPMLALGSLLGLIALLSNNQGDRYEKYFQGRMPQESESYDGKLQSPLLPSPISGFDAVAELTDGYARTSGIPSTTVVVSAAFLLVLLILLLALGRAGRFGTRTRCAQLIADARVGLLCQAFVVALLLFVAAGLGAILAYVVSPEIRAWSRMSIVLSVLALGVAGIAIEGAARRLRILLPVLAALTVVGLIDQLGGTAAALPLLLRRVRSALQLRRGSGHSIGRLKDPRRIRTRVQSLQCLCGPRRHLRLRRPTRRLEDVRHPDRRRRPVRCYEHGPGQAVAAFRHRLVKAHSRFTKGDWSSTGSSYCRGSGSAVPGQGPGRSSRPSC